MQKQQQIKKRD